MLSVDTLPDTTPPEITETLSFQSSIAPFASDASAFIARLDKHNRVQIDARVNGVPLEFQLDTGASHTVLTATHARLAAVAVEGQTRLAVVGGTITAHYGTADTFDVAGNRILGQRVLIVDGLERSLLGMDTVTRLNAPKLSILISQNQNSHLVAED